MSYGRQASPPNPWITTYYRRKCSVAHGSRFSFGKSCLALVLQPEKSNLLTSPNWPILFWNLVAWRAANLPGLSEVNLRQGDHALVTLPNETKSIQLIKPSGEEQTYSTQTTSLEIDTDEPGIYHIIDSERTYRFTVNLLSRGESNLVDARSDRIGHWASSSTLDTRCFQSLVWIFLLVSLSALAAHQVFITQKRSGGRTL